MGDPFSSTATPTTYYAVKDHQNSVIAMVNASGSVVESYEYDAYGNTKIFNASGTELTTSAIGNRYMFQGREYDFATGLYYFRARWYDPDTGRWLSKDPIGIEGGLNQYVFCDNNPVNLVDPSGKFGWAGAIVGGLVGGLIGGLSTGSWKGAVAGAIGGAITGATLNPALGAAAKLGLSGALAVAAGGAASGGLGGLASGLIDETWEALDCDPNTDFDVGEVLESALWGVGTGALTAGLGADGISAFADPFTEGAASAAITVWANNFDNLFDLAQKGGGE